MVKYMVAALAAYSLLMSSCGNGNMERSAEALSDSVSIYGMEPGEVKLVKKAGVQMKVKDVGQSAKDIAQLARESGGMVFHMQLDAAVDSKRELQVSGDSLVIYSAISPRASITARIPSENLEHFMFAAADKGYFISHSNLNIDDKSLDYLENSLKQKNRSQVLQRSSPAAKPINSIQTIAVKDEITDRLIQNRSIDADVQYSSIELGLYQNALVQKEVIANYSLMGYDLPFFQKLQASLFNGWKIFQSIFLFFANLWVIILLGFLALLVYRYFKRQGITITNPGV